MLFLLLILFSQQNHEFWLEPDKYFYKRGETINLRCRVGENYAGENWNGERSHIKSMYFYFGGVKDSCNQHYSDSEGDSLQIALLDEGTAMLTMNTENAIRSVEGDTVNFSKEYYQHSSKTIIQVGEDRDKTYKVMTNLPIDIIPDDHPYRLSHDDHFKVRVLFKKTVLKHHQVKVWHREKDKTSIQTLTTDENGEVKFFITPSGKWMISTVYTEKLENDPEASWQTYLGSLTWGYK